MITTFTQVLLHNEEHFQHKTELKDILQRYPQVNTRLGQLTDAFVRLYNEEDIALEYIAKSDLTKLIADKDRERDDTTTGLFRHIDADTYHFDPSRRQEAVSLQNIKNRYRDITRRSLDEQTASTYNLLQELNAKRDILERLHLAGWIDRLETENKAVNELMKGRDSEKAAQPVSRMKEVRPQIDKVTTNIYSALETFAQLTPDADITKCIEELNAVNKRYADNLAQRAGRLAAAAKKKKEADNANDASGIEE